MDLYALWIDVNLAWLYRFGVEGVCDDSPANASSFRPR